MHISEVVEELEEELDLEPCPEIDRIAREVADLQD
jgi:hypothetical protein